MRLLSVTERSQTTVKVVCGVWTVHVLVAGTSYCQDIVTSASLYGGALVKVSSGGTNRDRQSHGSPSQSHNPTIHKDIDKIISIV